MLEVCDFCGLNYSDCEYWSKWENVNEVSK